MMRHFLLIFKILQCIQYTHPSPFAVVPLHLLIAGQLSGPLWGAELSIELGPALQQADALLTSLRRTLNL
jgi:hypothetical protein